MRVYETHGEYLIIIIFTSGSENYRIDDWEENRNITHNRQDSIKTSSTQENGYIEHSTH